MMTMIKKKDIRECMLSFMFYNHIKRKKKVFY